MSLHSLPPQPKHYPRLPPEAEAHWLVFCHADAGAGEVGEGRSQEPSAHHCQREGRRRHRHPEDTVPTVQLLHGEAAAAAPLVRVVWLQLLTLDSIVVSDLSGRGEVQQSGDFSETTQAREAAGFLQVYCKNTHF